MKHSKERVTLARRERQGEPWAWPALVNAMAYEYIVEMGAQLTWDGPLAIVPFSGGGEFALWAVFGTAEESLDKIRARGLDAHPHYLNAPTQEGESAIDRYESVGYRPLWTCAIMACPLPVESDTPEGDAAGIEVREVFETAEARTVEGAYPVAVGARGMRHFVGTLDGRPAGLGRIVEGIPGITYVSAMHTVEDARRRGVGTAILHRLLSEASDESTVALLASSEMAHSLYARHGFETLGHYTTYRWRPARVYE